MNALLVVYIEPSGEFRLDPTLDCILDSDPNQGKPRQKGEHLVDLIHAEVEAEKVH
jgi:hypothetical protein